MRGTIVYVPPPQPRRHVCRPPRLFWPRPDLGTVWACDCGAYWIVAMMTTSPPSRSLEWVRC